MKELLGFGPRLKFFFFDRSLGLVPVLRISRLLAHYWYKASHKMFNKTYGKFWKSNSNEDSSQLSGFQCPPPLIWVILLQFPQTMWAFEYVLRSFNLSTLHNQTQFVSVVSSMYSQHAVSACHNYQWKNCNSSAYPHYLREYFFVPQILEPDKWMNAWLGLWLCWLQHNLVHCNSQPSPKFMSFYCMYLRRWWSTPDGHSIGLQCRTWRHHYEWFSN